MQRIKKLILGFSLFIFFLFSCNTDKSVRENNTVDFKISYIKDVNQVYSKNNIKSASFNKLTNEKLGYKNGWYWFKIEITNSLKSQPLIFEVKGNTIDTIKFFKNKKHVNPAGSSVSTKNHAYKIPFNDNAIYYAKVHFRKHVFFPLKIYTVDNYYKKTSISFFRNGLFYGFVIIVFIINIVFYFSLKDATFLTYATFLALTNIGLTDYDGLMAYYTKPEIRFYIGIALHFLVPLGTAFFTSTLLSHHKLVPNSIKIAGALFALSATFYTLFIVTEDFFYFAIGDLMGLGVFCYYMYLGICELKRQKFAKFSVIGYSLIWFSALFFIIPLNWGFSGFSLPLESVKVGSVFEMLVLTYAITYRVKILHQENKHYNQEIKKYIRQIIELEGKLQQTKASNNTERPIEEKINTISIKHQLTERESDVLLQIIYGLKNPEIAEKLFISVNTVKYHTRNIYDKLNVKKRIEITSKILFEN